MTITIPTSHGPVQFSAHLVQAVVRNAQRQADLTAHALQATGLFASLEEVQLPAAFLLEMGAVLQIGFWEREGLEAHNEAGLPSYAKAARELGTRALKGPQEFEGRDAAPLSRRVVQFWIDRIAWDGWELMGTDIVVGDVDEDAFVEVLAEFLWEHRYELSGTLTPEGGDR